MPPYLDLGLAAPLAITDCTPCVRVSSRAILLVSPYRKTCRIIASVLTSGIRSRVALEACEQLGAALLIGGCRQLIKQPPVNGGAAGPCICSYRAHHEHRD